ncbi:flagellar hook-basal body complex protein FliE [Buchnera aphidicola (Mollitrichosiphum nigrofasciatum)]|uniref:flagellar hook-basal body complex protein FliE n=1 Tax=Buchnera aphidicola TaxID=9 RepID=UPI0031B89B48
MLIEKINNTKNLNPLINNTYINKLKKNFFKNNKIVDLTTTKINNFNTKKEFSQINDKTILKTQYIPKKKKNITNIQTIIQIRNQLINAYQEIMNMQI